KFQCVNHHRTMLQFQATAPLLADPLSSALLTRILAKLEIDHPAASWQGLTTAYAAWCQHVPFDNVRKLIHVKSGDTGPLPGGTAEDFFTAWLQHGTGGTCWSGSNALHAFLSALGFPVERGIATMMAAPVLPPNHGTVMIVNEGKRYLLDASMLHGEPLLLDEHQTTQIDHLAWGLTCGQRDGKLHVHWRPMHKVDGFDCRLEWTGSSGPDHRAFYSRTHEWSPFNYELNVRLNCGDDVEGMAFGKWITLYRDGSVSSDVIALEERNQRLIEEIGLSEEIVAQIPPDSPTPPPPGSRTAAALEP
ncbi:MAG: hypothetical protein JWO89_563, partial [Verrucomicrobiaceae bacterium]|nr:hypothetical protein [Verrucomicrobiaceae bacterium]